MYVNRLKRLFFQLISSYYRGIRELNSIPGVIAKIANKIFLDEKFELNENFQLLSKIVFQSSVQKVDFSNPPTAASTINSWVRIQNNIF